MSELPGNNHYNGAMRFMNWAREGHHPSPEEMTPKATAYRETALVQSVLALTYEQRTANLLDLFMHIDRQGDMPDQASQLFNEIADRLGLRDANA